MGRPSDLAGVWTHSASWARVVSGVGSWWGGAPLRKDMSLAEATGPRAGADALAREAAERRPVGRPSDLAGVWGGAPR